MVKILLLTPPLLRHNIPLVFKFNAPNIGLGYLAAILLKEGHNVKIVDLKFFNFKKFLKLFMEFSPEIVGINAFTVNIFEAALLSNFLRKYNSNLLILIGGPHISAIPIQTMKQYENFDIGVINEGEETIVEIVNAYKKDKNYSKIKGIVYRNNHGNPKDGDEIIISEPREFIKNLDEIPFPDWKLFNLNNYSTFAILFASKLKMLTVLTQRGCPYSCVFCQNVLGKKVRQRSIDNIIEEIERNIEIYEVKEIGFLDATFTFNKKRTIELCKELIRRGINKRISWMCFSRVSDIDEKVIKYMRLAGCRLISYGIDSGNEKTLKLMKKGITLEQATNAVKLTKKYGIKCHTGFIYGFPGENIKDIKNTRKFAQKIKKLGSDFVTFGELIPFPNTAIYDWAKDEKYGIKFKNENWDKFEPELGGVLSNQNFPEHFIQIYKMMSYLLFYSIPPKFLNILKIVNLKNIIRYYIFKYLIR